MAVVAVVAAGAAVAAVAMAEAAATEEVVAAVAAVSGEAAEGVAVALDEEVAVAATVSTRWEDVMRSKSNQSACATFGGDGVGPIWDFDFWDLFSGRSPGTWAGCSEYRDARNGSSGRS